MTESEVRKLLRRMKELDSQTAFRAFYDMTYDRLYRIAYYYVKREEWSQEIVLDAFDFGKRAALFPEFQERNWNNIVSKWHVLL